MASAMRSCVRIVTGFFCASGILWWDGIVSAASPGVATQQAFGTEPTAVEKAMFFDGFEEILRAGGGEAAAGAGSANRVDDR